MNTLEQRSERLFQAIGGVGSDLIDQAETQTFRPGFVRRLLPLVACLTLFLALGVWLQLLLPAEQEAGPQMAAPPQTAAPAEPAAYHWSDRPVTPKKRMTVHGTIYYIEAVYEAKNARLGDQIGQADGMAVYIGGETFKEDHWGREMPLEIFVEQENGQYWYCLTYYAWDGAACTLEEAQTLEDLSVLALGEAFADPAELTEPQLVQFFLQTLELERQTGRRTEDLNRYLWYDAAEDCYIIPMEDIAVQLDRYLDGHTWPKLAEHRALQLQSLQCQRPPETFSAAVWEEDRLILTTDRQEYTIRFTEGRCIYESIQER